MREKMEMVFFFFFVWGEELVCIVYENNFHIPLRTNISINDYLPKFIANMRTITWEKRDRIMEFAACIAYIVWQRSYQKINIIATPSTHTNNKNEARSMRFFGVFVRSISYNLIYNALDATFKAPDH